MFKNKFKIFIIITFFMTILVSLILGNIEKSKYEYIDVNVERNKELALINIDSLSDEFMEQYFNEMKELNDLNNKSNILIVTSENDIGDGHGAIKIVAGPNNQYFLQYSNEENKNYAFNKFKEDKKIFAVTENTVYNLTDVSDYNDDINYNWAMEKCAFSYAIEEIKTKNLNDVIVAVIDTGCEVSVFNEAYPGRLFDTYNVLDKTFDVTDKWTHGTFVAGIIAETTPENVKILPIKIKNKYDGGTASDLIEAINYAVLKDVDVINISMGAGWYDKNIELAINSASQKGITIVGAAGNENEDSYKYPVAYDNVIAVSAVDSHFERASFSNYADYIDFAAPGYHVENISYSPVKDQQGNTLYFESFRKVKDGTSFSAPYVAGAVAILKSLNTNPEYIFTKEDIVELLKKYAIDVGKTGYDEYYGHGVISFEGAKFASEGEEADKWGIFKKDEISTYSAIRIEASKKFVAEYNYGNNTNIMQAELDIYYTENAYYTKTLGQLAGEIEILDYEPFKYTEQNVRIKYKNLETILKVDNRNLSNGWEYVLEDDDTIKLTGMNCNNETLVSTYEYSNYPQLIYIPSTIDGKEVKTLGENLLTDKNRIKRIVIPYGITTLEKNVFGRTKELEDSEYSLYGTTELVFPKSINYIDKEAFKFRNKNEIKFILFSNTAASQYAIDNDYNYIYISNAKSNLEKKNYFAFEEVTEKFIVDVTYDGTDGVFNEVVDKYNIIYSNGDSFRYGDNRVVVAFETMLGIYVELPISVTIDKAIPEYTIPSDLIGIQNQKLSEVDLPEGFSWQDESMVLNKIGNITYKATYTPEDIENYEIVENIEITIEVKIKENIDKELSQPEIEYSTQEQTKENIIVTITANEELQEVEGWTISEDKMKLTKTYEQNTTEEVTIKDIAGNEANVLIDIQNIDKELSQPEIEYSSTEPTKENVTVTITANEELQEVEGWTISEDKKQLTKTYEQNTTEEVTIKDIAGNEANVLIDIQNIDKELSQPEIEYSSTEQTKENVTVTITANEELQEVEGWTISEDKKQLTKTYEQNTTEEVTIKDIAGNEANVLIDIQNIDKELSQPEIEYSSTEPTKENVTVTITANEELQEVEGWTISEDKKQLTKTYEQNTTEEVTIKDIAGNEANVLIDIQNIDKELSQPEIEYSSIEPTKENVTVTITANEELQEIESWTISEDKKQLTKTYEQNTTEEVTIKDIAGNEANVLIDIQNIDKELSQPEIEYSSTEPTKENVTVTITANEELQEVEGWTISEDKKQLTKTYEQNTTEEVTIKDIAGNEANVLIDIQNIDKELSQPEIEYSSTEQTKENVTVTITANEELQEVEGWTISEDKKQLTKTYEQNTTEEVTIKDIAGNEANVLIDIQNIDKELSQPEIEYSSTEQTKENVTVTITANEELQEVEGWTISEDKKQLTKTYEQNTTEEVTIKDIAGNEANVLIDIQNIDKELSQPEIEYSSTEPTKENVTVTITANEELQEVEGWTISEDKKQLTKTYEQNTTEEVTIKDIAGNEANVLIDIQNIDKELSQPEIEYSSTEPTKENVTVTITANEELQEIEGWTMSEDKKQLTKVYNKNTEEEIIIKDLVGNEAVVEIKINNIEDYFYIEGYEIQDGYVLEIPEQIKIEDFISKIKTNQEYTICEMRKEEGETEEKEVEAEGIIKTGQVIKVNGKVICTLVVKGDVTGNGIIDINDAINTLRHAVEQEGKELVGAYLKAAYMNEDNFVDVTDAIQILQYSVSK